MNPISFNSLIRKNLVLFTWYTVIIIFLGVGIWRFNQIDLLAFFNPIREGFWIPFFQYATLLGEPFVFVICFVILIFFNYRWALMVPICGLSTMLISFVLKSIFSHPRPFYVLRTNNWLDKIRMLDGVVTYEGFTSFPSGHTFAAFSIFTLTSLLISDKKYFPYVALSCCLLVAASRVYLIHHFVHDVLFGMILGVSLAILLYMLQWKYLNRFAFLNGNLINSLGNRRKTM
jgi:membrane-associated phospholipid phosphatase